jgi:hypothetical protein
MLPRRPNTPRTPSVSPTRRRGKFTKRLAAVAVTLNGLTAALAATLPETGWAFRELNVMLLVIRISENAVTESDHLCSAFRNMLRRCVPWNMVDFAERSKNWAACAWS